MGEFKDYTRLLSIVFMGIGFVFVVIGFYTIEPAFYIAVGWETATVIIMALMQTSVHEWFSLKKKLKLAAAAEKDLKKARED